MIRAILRNAGVKAPHLAAAIRGWNRYVRERGRFKPAALKAGWKWGRELPMLTEWNEASGSAGAYFIQDQTVAQWILQAAPFRHVDVGSRLDGFVGSLSVFREIDVIDIRPQPVSLKNISFHQIDLMGPLPDEWLSCTDSLSCLHTIEHFGLGRYGDPLDADGHLKGLEQLKRLVKPGGMIYLSTPIGPERVEFNAHRVFAARTLAGWFSAGWKIERFALINDSDTLIENVDWRGGEIDNHFGCRLGVGIIAARKLPFP